MEILSPSTTTLSPVLPLSNNPANLVPAPDQNAGQPETQIISAVPTISRRGETGRWGSVQPVAMGLAHGAINHEDVLMFTTGRPTPVRCIGLLAVFVAGLSLLTPLGYAQSSPATAAASAPATATAPASAPSKKIAVDEVLSKKLASFNYERAPIATVIKHIAESYDLDVNNEYDLTDNITFIRDDVSARQAINFLNTTLLSLGYTVIETVPEGQSPPRRKLTSVPTTKDAGTLVPLYSGYDPAMIPEGNERRTQVMVLKNADVEKARDMIVAIVGRQAEVTINVPTKTLIITDTSSHVHTSAALVTQLEKEAAAGK